MPFSVVLSERKADLIPTIRDEFPEGLAKCGRQGFNIQDDVQVLGGAELQSGLLHRQARGRAADLYAQ